MRQSATAPARFASMLRAYQLQGNRHRALTVCTRALRSSLLLAVDGSLLSDPP